MDHYGRFGRRQLEMSEEYDGRRIRPGLGEKTVQVPVERNAYSIFSHGKGEYVLIWRRSQPGFARVHHINPILAKQFSQPGGKIFVKKQPKH